MYIKRGRIQWEGFRDGDPLLSCYSTHSQNIMLRFEVFPDYTQSRDVETDSVCPLPSALYSTYLCMYSMLNSDDDDNDDDEVCVLQFYTFTFTLIFIHILKPSSEIPGCTQLWAMFTFSRFHYVECVYRQTTNRSFVVYKYSSTYFITQYKLQMHALLGYLQHVIEVIHTEHSQMQKCSFIYIYNKSWKKFQSLTL